MSAQKRPLDILPEALNFQMEEFQNDSTIHKDRAKSLLQLAKACKKLRQLYINLAICDRLLLLADVQIDEDDIKETYQFADKQEINFKEEVLHMQPRLQYQLLSEDNLTSTINNLWRLNSATRQDIYESLSMPVIKKIVKFANLDIKTVNLEVETANLELYVFNLLQDQANIKIPEYENLVHAMIAADM